MSIVIYTNIVLDLLVFDDPASAALAAALDSGELHWISCTPMRDELARVLGYPIIAAHLERRARHVDEVLAALDARVREVLPLAARAPCVCTSRSWAYQAAIVSASVATMVRPSTTVATRRSTSRT